MGVRSRPPARRACPPGCRAIAVTFITDRAGLFLTPEVFGRRATIRALTLEKMERKGEGGAVFYLPRPLCAVRRFTRGPLGWAPGWPPEDGFYATA